MKMSDKCTEAVRKLLYSRYSHADTTHYKAIRSMPHHARVYQTSIRFLTYSILFAMNYY